MSFTPYKETNSGEPADLHAKAQSGLKEETGECLHDFGIGKGSSNRKQNY